MRIFRHYIPLPYLFLGLLELLVFLGAFYAGVGLRFINAPVESLVEIHPILPKALVFAAVLVLSLGALGLYERRINIAGFDAFVRMLMAYALSLIPLTVIFYLLPGLFLGRGALALAYLAAFVGSYLLRLVFIVLGSAELLNKRVLILGAGLRAGELLAQERQGQLHGVSLVAFAAVPGHPRLLDDPRLTELSDDLCRWARSRELDEIVLAVDDRRQGLPLQQLLDCKMAGTQVIDLSTFYEREVGKIHIGVVNPSWMFLSDGFQMGSLRLLLKRASDLIFTLPLLVLALPVMILVALAILIESRGRGTVLYRQVRVGENGVPFTILKFRSMQMDAEKPGQAVWAQKSDPRVTRVGAVIRKLRLDELPQLFNVLRGEMSLVGPRPERPQFVEELQRDIPYYSERHRVKPGLTGWAQIRYEYGASAEDALEKLEYDLYYVKNHSLFMDVLILLQTAEVVLFGKGAR